MQNVRESLLLTIAYIRINSKHYVATVCFYHVTYVFQIESTLYSPFTNYLVVGLSPVAAT